MNKTPFLLPCEEARRLFDISWNAPLDQHGILYANYLEHLAECMKCKDIFSFTPEEQVKLHKDAGGFRRGAELLKKGMRECDDARRDS